MRELNCGHERFHGWRRRATDESGQAMVLVAVMIGMLLVCVGLVVDVGHAMLVQRQLQAGVDAAALAGAQDLPAVDPGTGKYVAELTALGYSPTPGKKNAVSTVGNATTSVTIRCITAVPGCSGRYGTVNALTVEASSKVPTWFGKIAGISNMTVNAKATACSPCTEKPLDIMVVLDRTGSMCAPEPCYDGDNVKSDLEYAEEGVETFLGYLDPSLDKVGLALFPPARTPSLVSACPNTPTSGGSYYGYDAYWPDAVGLVPYPPADPNWPTWVPKPPSTPSRYLHASLEGADGVPGDDYLVKDPVTGWGLNPNSALVQRLRCARGAGTTSYALSVEEAQHELYRNGRGNTQDVIIFLSDGAANTSPMNLPNGHWTNNPFNQQRPCGTGVEAAQRAKDAGAIIYTIGYDLDAGGNAPERCLKPLANGHIAPNTMANWEVCGSWGCNAYDAIRAMASQPSSDFFYLKPNAGQLNQIFSAIATDILNARVQLIEDSLPDLIP